VSAVYGCIVCDYLVVIVCYAEQSGQLLVGLCYSEQLCVVGGVFGVTQLRDVVYVVFSSAIRRYNATTHRRLADIVVMGCRYPLDIAACELTCQLYVADHVDVWRVSSDGVDIQRWLTKSPSDTFRPHKLSVTSSRLLVTSIGDRQLRQFDAAGGDELRRVGLPDYMEPWHAVESPTATFIVGHSNTQLSQWQVSEVSTEGQVLRQFSGSSLGWPEHIVVDRQGNIFVADSGYRHILLLDAQLALRRVIIDARQLNGRWSQRLCYTEQSGQLLVGFEKGGVAVFDVLRR